jgi:hypothetical protein
MKLRELTPGAHFRYAPGTTGASLHGSGEQKMVCEFCLAFNPEIIELGEEPVGPVLYSAVAGGTDDNHPTGSKAIRMSFEPLKDSAWFNQRVDPETGKEESLGKSRPDHTKRVLWVGGDWVHDNAYFASCRGEGGRCRRFDDEGAAIKWLLEGEGL